MRRARLVPPSPRCLPAGRLRSSPTHASPRPAHQPGVHPRRKAVSTLGFSAGLGAGFLHGGDRGQVLVTPNLVMPPARPCCVSALPFPGADPRVSPPFLQSLLVPRQRRRADAAGPLSPRRPGRPRHPAARPADQHAEPRGGGVRRHHQQPHPARLHRRQGLRKDLGYQPAGQQKPHFPARLPGKGSGGGPSPCRWRAARSPPAWCSR